MHFSSALCLASDWLLFKIRGLGGIGAWRGPTCFAGGDGQSLWPGAGGNVPVQSSGDHCAHLCAAIQVEGEWVPVGAKHLQIFGRGVAGTGGC
jgi:hypothetical protein